MAFFADAIQRDTRANQPAASAVIVGALYCVTDEGHIVERSDGATWEAFSPTGSGTGDVTAVGTLTADTVILGDGGTTVTALANGTAGQVLTMNGGATAPEWAAAAAGGTPALVLITETVTASSAASVTFSSISASYRDLVVKVRGRGDTAAGGVNVLLRVNGDTAANYAWQEFHANATSASATENTAATSIFVGALSAATATASHAGALEARIFDYRGTTFFKEVTAQAGTSTGTASFSQGVSIESGSWRSTAAVTSVTILLSAGNFVDGSVVSLYGAL